MCVKVRIQGISRGENLIVKGDWHSTTEVEAFSLAKPQVICADKI